MSVAFGRVSDGYCLIGNKNIMGKCKVKGFFKDDEITGLDLICVLSGHLSEEQKKEVVRSYLKDELPGRSDEEIEQMVEGIIYGTFVDLEYRVYFQSDVTMYV